MEELIYTVHIKDSIEIVESLWTPLFLLLLIFIAYKINILINKKKDIKFIKIIFRVVFIFILFNVFLDYYFMSRLYNRLEIALSNNKCKNIDGIVKQYSYKNLFTEKVEYFTIKNIHFEIRNSDRVIINKNKKLRLKIEYIDFPKFNPTIVRVWKL